MAITKTTYVERVLIVLNPDGALKGAHQEGLEIVRDGEDVISTRQLPAAPVAANSIAAILPDIASALQSLAAVTAERDAAMAEVERLSDELSSLSGQSVQTGVTVTKAQARVALRRAGILEAVDAAVAAAGGEALDAWEYAPTVSRNAALVATLAAALSLSDAAVDELFRVASGVTF